jgi:carbon monoxide dehydrogenase subunit G
MLKKIALVIVVLAGALLAYATTRPDSMHVERSTSIQAPPEKIFPLINDFHSWNSWSPYEKLDPAMKKNYSGAADGKGAVYEWEGNSAAGQGRMEITDTAPPSRITIKLDFIKPFEGHNIAEFTLVPQGGSTNVRWSMDGPSPYVAKLMGVFVNMDTMVGTDFETGLASLKAIAER